MCLSSFQIQQALSSIGVAAGFQNHEQLVDQLLATSSTTSAQLTYMAHLNTVAPFIPIRVSVYANRTEASLYITLAKRARQR
jgi:hypothetical protein